MASARWLRLAAVRAWSVVGQVAETEPALIRSAAAAVAVAGARYGLHLDADRLMEVTGVVLALAGWSIRGAVWSPAGHQGELDEALKVAASIHRVAVSAPGMGSHWTADTPLVSAGKPPGQPPS